MIEFKEPQKVDSFVILNNAATATYYFPMVGLDYF